MHRVIDTNVLVVANNRESPQASPQCVTSCSNWLQSHERSGITVIDDKYLILREYIRYYEKIYANKVNYKKVSQYSGDDFIKWILLNQGNPQRCQQVSITQISEHEFEEFPKSASLQNFDPSDRKFVAVALTHPQRPAIAIAVDSDWYIHKDPLSEHGIEIEFLC